MIDFDENVMLVYKVYDVIYSSCRDLKDDLIQEGLLGLWKACQTFNADRGVAFSTYAFVCIRNQMGMFMRKENRYCSHKRSLDDYIDGNRSEDTLLDMVPAPERDREFDEMLAYVIEKLEDKRCAEIIELKLAGTPQKEIAKKLCMSEALVSEKLAYVYKILREEM